MQRVGKINKIPVSLLPLEMANRTEKLAENVPGRFYVDAKCIDCDLCRLTAPANFTRNPAKGYSYVSRQPSTPKEEVLCRQALKECPVDAIGDNGED